MIGRQFASFAEFYPFYLREHANRTCRRLHFVGTLLVVACALAGVASRDTRWFAAAPIAGYGFAWIGHYYFDHNRPATFSHPLYSLAGDWVMFRDLLTGRIPL